MGAERAAECVAGDGGTPEGAGGTGEAAGSCTPAPSAWGSLPSKGTGRAPLSGRQRAGHVQFLREGKPASSLFALKNPDHHPMEMGNGGNGNGEKKKKNKRRILNATSIKAKEF